MLETLLVNTLIFLASLLTYVTVIFVIAVARRDNSVMDIAYGPAFFVAALFTLFYSSGTSPTAFLITGLTGLWSIRLALRIYKKNKGKPEDIRYATWRTEWSKLGRAYFLRRSYLQINLLQGGIIFLVSLPFIVASSSPQASNSIFIIIGTLVFFFGLAYEATADYQLDSFLRNKKSGRTSEPLMKTGLFKFSRRPNYFGESLIWWGLAIIVLPMPFGLLGLISPIVITYVVTKVTGPMLENIFLEKYPTEYTEYTKMTNYFVPGLPRKS